MSLLTLKWQQERQAWHMMTQKIDLSKTLQRICNELNVGKVPLPVNDSSDKHPLPISTLNLPKTDVSSIASHTTSSSSGVKSKHPPQIKTDKKSSSQKQQVYANKNKWVRVKILCRESVCGKRTFWWGVKRAVGDLKGMDRADGGWE